MESKSVLKWSDGEEFNNTTIYLTKSMFRCGVVLIVIDIPGSSVLDWKAVTDFDYIDDEVGSFPLASGIEKTLEDAKVAVESWYFENSIFLSYLSLQATAYADVHEIIKKILNELKGEHDGESSWEFDKRD